MGATPVGATPVVLDTVVMVTVTAKFSRQRPISYLYSPLIVVSLLSDLPLLPSPSSLPLFCFFFLVWQAGHHSLVSQNSCRYILLSCRHGGKLVPARVPCRKEARLQRLVLRLSPCFLCLWVV
jgi:hypothetical protein